MKRRSWDSFYWNDDRGFLFNKRSSNMTMTFYVTSRTFDIQYMNLYMYNYASRINE